MMEGSVFCHTVKWGAMCPPDHMSRAPVHHLPHHDSDIHMYSTERGGDGDSEDLSFHNINIRMDFIRKVYGILMCQNAITVAIVAFFNFHLDTKLWIIDHHEVWWLTMILMLMTLIALVCYHDGRRKAPINYICLSIFTAVEAFFLGCLTSKFNIGEVFFAALITLVVTVSLTLFTFQTKVDFTAKSGTLFVTVIIFIVFSIVCLFIVPSKIMTVVYAALGALVFCSYIVYDTQMIIGGYHEYFMYSISPEEYVFATLNLFIDSVHFLIYNLSTIDYCFECVQRIDLREEDE